MENFMWQFGMFAYGHIDKVDQIEVEKGKWFIRAAGQFYMEFI